MPPPPPRSTLFPYTTLFRSVPAKRVMGAVAEGPLPHGRGSVVAYFPSPLWLEGDRKSTRLNSSHTVISYAVFCLKKKKTFTLAIDNNRCMSAGDPHASIDED